MKDMPAEPVLNTSHQIVKEVYEHGTAGYILRRACRFERDRIEYSQTFFYTVVDVSSKEDPMFFDTAHSLGIQEDLVKLLIDNKVERLNIFDFRYQIQYWVDMSYFNTHKIGLYRTNEDLKLSIKYLIVPFEDFDMVFAESSTYPMYLVNEQNIDVSMIPKREFKYEGRVPIDKL